jgi:hypothetical protein
MPKRFGKPLEKQHQTDKGENPKKFSISLLNIAPSAASQIQPRTVRTVTKKDTNLLKTDISVVDPDPGEVRNESNDKKMSVLFY